MAQLAPAGPAVGSLRVVCSTPGAEVFVDGEMKGTVNSAIQGVPVGEHIVEVRAKGYAAQSVNVTISAGAQSVARVDLASQPEKPLTARLRVVTPVPERRGVRRRRVGGAGAVRSQRSGAGQALRHRARARVRRVEARGRSRPDDADDAVGGAVGVGHA